jgi:hypothetical protein
MEADEQAGGPLTWPGPGTETNEASFCVKISKIAIVDSFWQGVGGGRIGLIFELSKEQSIGDDDMQELCRRVGLGPSSRRAVFTSKPDQQGTRAEKWTVNFHTLTELGKTFLELATGETSDGMVKVPCVQGGYLTEDAANARVVPTTFSPTPHGIDVTDLTMSGMNHTVKTLNRVKRDEGMRTALQGAKLFEATTMLPGAKLRAETYGAINMCYRTAAQMNGGGAVYSVHVFFKYREVSDEVALKVQNKEDDFGKLLTGEDAASENEGGTPIISVRGRGVGEGPIDHQVKFIRGFQQSGLYFRDMDTEKGRGPTWGQVRRMEAGESGGRDKDLEELVVHQMEKHRIGGQGGLGYDIKDAVTDLNMEPNETSTGRKVR